MSATASSAVEASWTPAALASATPAGSMRQDVVVAGGQQLDRAQGG